MTSPWCAVRLTSEVSAALTPYAVPDDCALTTTLSLVAVRFTVALASRLTTDFASTPVAQLDVLPFAVLLIVIPSAVISAMVSPYVLLFVSLVSARTPVVLAISASRLVFVTVTLTAPSASISILLCSL